MIKKILLYWHTLRHLKFSQFYERLKFNLYHPTPSLNPPPFLRPSYGYWVKPLSAACSLIGPKEFIFFGFRGSLEVFGWHGSGREKLWRYNQHYFNDLNAQASADRYEWHIAILKDWIKKNPPSFGVGWEPYPTSLRIVNWIKWSLAENILPTECIRSLAIQVRFLTKRLEYHLLGNHLLANAKALIFAGLFFQGKEADDWLQKGVKILKSELAEQILEDGGHFELSPMYHAIILEDLLDLINASRLWPKSINSSVVLEWEIVAAKMLRWLEMMIHPDGEISFFNDAAFGIAAKPLDLFFYAHTLGLDFQEEKDESPLTINVMKNSGYIKLKSLNDCTAILDVAHVGPDYIPGHAHADSLSFELSLYGRRVIVNGGTSVYELGAQRLRERQTAAHSTVEVNGISSSEVWSGFRVAQRAKPFGLHIEKTHKELYVSCSHNGYARLKGSPVHHRKWRLAENSLTITDQIIGGDYQSIARFIFHPSILIHRLNANDWCIGMPLGQRVLFKVMSGLGFMESASYAPKFGMIVGTQSISIELKLGFSQVRLLWD